jgi:hypothetical protein
MRLVRIPRRFFDDHDTRGLSAPVVHHATSHHYWIDARDGAIADLISDAQFYADPAAQDHDFGARALLRALDKAGIRPPKEDTDANDDHARVRAQ